MCKSLRRDDARSVQALHGLYAYAFQPSYRAPARVCVSSLPFVRRRIAGTTCLRAEHVTLQMVNRATAMKVSVSAAGCLVL